MAEEIEPPTFHKGKYQLEVEEIGKGSFGIVYKGKDSNSGTSIAAKKIKYIERGQEVNEVLSNMGRTELEIFRKLKEHKNIVRLLDDLDDGKSHWIIMEFCDCGDLLEYFKNNQLDFNVKVKVITECASAIAFMHSFTPPIVHRDIKPTNVLIKRQSNEDVAKITDFGIGKLYDDPRTSHLTMTTAGGTMSYMAPEFFDADGGYLRYQPGIDIFSLGLLFHVMLLYGEDKDSKDMLPSSEESRRSRKYIHYGFEMVNAAKLNQPPPVLSQLTSVDKPEVNQLKKMIKQMTAYKVQDRIPLIDVKNITLEMYCNSLQTLLNRICGIVSPDDKGLVAVIKETMDEYRRQSRRMTQMTQEIKLLHQAKGTSVFEFRNSQKQLETLWRELFSLEENHRRIQQELAWEKEIRLNAESELELSMKEQVEVQNKLRVSNMEHMETKNELIVSKAEHMRVQNELDFFKTRLTLVKSQHLQVQNEMKGLKTEHLEVQNELKLSKTENMKMKNELKDLKTEQIKAHNELELSKQTRLNVENQLKLSRINHAKAEDELRYCQKEYMEKINELKLCEDCHLKERQDLLEARKGLSEAKKELSATRGKVSETDKELTGLKSKVSHSQLTLDRTKQLLFELQVQLENSTKDLSDVQVQLKIAQDSNQQNLHDLNLLEDHDDKHVLQNISWNISDNVSEESKTKHVYHSSNSEDSDSELYSKIAPSESRTQIDEVLQQPSPDNLYGDAFDRKDKNSKNQPYTLEIKTDELPYRHQEQAILRQNSQHYQFHNIATIVPMPEMKVYHRCVLLQIRFNALCKIKPAGLPDFPEIILDSPGDHMDNISDAEDFTFTPGYVNNTNFPSYRPHNASRHPRH